MSSHGYFDDAAREYVITDPRTPVKWINYIGTLAFGGFVDHTGGALICRNDPALNRITKYISQMPASDFKGETLYVRVKTAQGYAVHSPFFVPCLVPYQQFECRVGLGYTRWVTRTADIETDVTVFVPRGQAREIRDVRITNRGPQPLTVDAVPVVEYTHFDALKQLTNADWVPQTMQSWKVEASGVSVFCQAAFMRKDTQVNYFCASLPASSFETDRKRFLGGNEYGTWANPLSLQADELSNYEARRGDNIAALLIHLGTLAPDETRRFITQLGQTEDLQADMADIVRFNDPAAADAALQEMAAFWQDYLDKIQVHTPDAAMNAMLNVHNPRQCYITKTWSRYLSLYQLGYGARGIGYRDSSQDIMAVLASVPGEAKALLKQLLAVQKRSGCSYHQFNPLSMEASEGDALEREDRPHYYSDDHLWAVLAACAYIKETGDYEFLKEIVPFYEKDKTGAVLENATVMEHLDRAVAFTGQDLGAHGLPLLGFADWNDTINLATGAESMLTACLNGRARQDLADLCIALGDTASAQAHLAAKAVMAERVQQAGWDGEWYLSYFDADGSPLGSHINEAGQIIAYSQAFPVLAGFATPEQARSALDAVHQRLNTRNGIKLSAPGFNGFDPRKGGITTYPPGAKENGGIFMHVNPWVMIAETMTGNGERAFAYYAQTNPAGKNDLMEEWECEPYVYPQNVLADEHPQFGLARNSWLSGTASWMFQAATQYILGVRPDYDGLRIDPCIPADWDGFKVTRVFRGATYEIEVRNPQHVNKGIARISLDGALLEGTLLPVFPAGSTHTVVVEMGA